MNAELDQKTIEHDEAATVQALALLSTLKYAKRRKDAAEELGISVGALDKAVKEAKTANSDSKGQGRPLELPEIEPWSTPVNGAELIDEVCTEIRHYMILPEGGAETMALWALHTHVFDCFNHSPRLAITSPEKGCGKTTALDVLRELVARPLPTSNVTVSAVFRTVEMAKPTLLIDEADTFLKDNQELRGILNSGHRKGTPIIRTVGDDYEPRQFSTWAPAAVAMIGNLPVTLDDRAVAIRLRRRQSAEPIRGFRSDRVGNLRDLARKAARWTADHSDTLAKADPDMGCLFNRAADNWRPLFAIAKAAGGEWPKLIRKVAETAEGKKQDQSVRTQLLSDIQDILFNRPHSDRISSTELASLLALIEGRPWAEWGRSHKPITAAALARMLSPFGIISATKRIGVETFKGYLYSEFDEAFASYLPPKGDLSSHSPESPYQNVTRSQPNNDGHCDTFQTVTRERCDTSEPSHGSDVTLLKVSQPNNDGHCDGVTFWEPENGGEEEGRPGRCGHCQESGDLVEAYWGDATARLHRQCIEPWREAQDDLNIPAFLDRRAELSGH